jgi:hypothetical protein
MQITPEQKSYRPAQSAARAEINAQSAENAKIHMPVIYRII